jgi:hypothetical protein
MAVMTSLPISCTEAVLLEERCIIVQIMKVRQMCGSAVNAKKNLRLDPP